MTKYRPELLDKPRYQLAEMGIEVSAIASTILHVLLCELDKITDVHQNEGLIYGKCRGVLSAQRGVHEHEDE